MNIQILHSWLKEFLDTNASPYEIARTLALCGPSIEKVNKSGNDWIYNIEIITNRVDYACVRGIAFEASVILPQFGFKAKFRDLKLNEPRLKIKPALKLIIKTDKNLVKRVMAVIIDNVSQKDTPDWMKKRLEAAGIRSLNSLIDITNYVMLEIGHPTHVFDYDRIKTKTLVFRESKKGEKIIGLDGKTYILPGCDIVIDNGRGEIIDLPGILGTNNSIVTKDTKRIIFFIDNNDPVKIRKTSINLAIRTVAATLNEKGVDPELGKLALLRGIELYNNICDGTLASNIMDYYISTYHPKQLSVAISFIESHLGISIHLTKVVNILKSLGFKTLFDKNSSSLKIKIPSWRANDVTIAEDIVEEIARIYGYHNLPSKLMSGELPDRFVNSAFEFEKKIKQILKGFGGVEIYTLSLVPYQKGDTGLKLKNNLGLDSLYLRASLMPSLITAAKENLNEKEPFHLFELANVFIPKKNELPSEIMMLAGIMYNYTFREAKGIVESLLNELNIDYTIETRDGPKFLQNHRIVIKAKDKVIGEFGSLENEILCYYQFKLKDLSETANAFPSYKEMFKFPPHIEDISLVFPERTSIGNVLNLMKSQNLLIEKAELIDIYKNSYTFRIWYRDSRKTLSDKEVELLRNKLLDKIQKKFGGTLRS